MNSFYSSKELSVLGFKHVGCSVLISRNAKFYGIENMSIGDHVRIDDFCILSGNIILGSYIHIGPFCTLYGLSFIEFQDFTGMSARSTIYSSMDDFSGEFLMSPMVDDDFTNVTGGKVLIKRLGISV